MRVLQAGKSTSSASRPGLQPPAASPRHGGAPHGARL